MLLLSTLLSNIRILLPLSLLMSFPMPPQGGSFNPELREQQNHSISLPVHVCVSSVIFLYLALALVMPSEAQQLFMLPRHKVDSSVLQQCREDKEKTHCHPDVYGLHIRDL